MIRGFDHIALPMQEVTGMLAFYEALGARIVEERPGYLHAVYLGQNKINLHTPAAWQHAQFTLRGLAALPGCGDLCFVWDGTVDSVRALLDAVGVKVIEGPASRRGGRGVEGTSVYVRDPDRNLLEFIVYE